MATEEEKLIFFSGVTVGKAPLCSGKYPFTQDTERNPENAMGSFIKEERKTMKIVKRMAGKKGVMGMGRGG